MWRICPLFKGSIITYGKRERQRGIEREIYRQRVKEKQRKREHRERVCRLRKKNQTDIVR